MPLTLSTSVDDGLRKANETFRFATLWRIERQDGVILRFTDHDAPITFGGYPYAPAGGFNASAREAQVGTSESSNLEVIGIIDSAAITEADLRAGRYDDAQVYEYLVDWRYPYADAYLQARRAVTKVKYSTTGWQAELRGVMALLATPIGRLVTRKCRYRLGDTFCTVNLAAFTVTGTISAIDTQRQVFKGSTHAIQTDAYYKHGLLTWTSGANLGISIEIQKYIAATRQFTTFLPLPFDFQVGDAYSVYAGCDKELSTCGTKFSNRVNFGGFPYVPGLDKTLDTPPAS